MVLIKLLLFVVGTSSSESDMHGSNHSYSWSNRSGRRWSL